jgi:hypothetical protein
MIKNHIFIMATGIKSFWQWQWRKRTLFSLV